MSYVLTGLGSKLLLTQSNGSLLSKSSAIEPVLTEGGGRASEAAASHFPEAQDNGGSNNEGSDSSVEVTGALLAVGIGLATVWLIKRGAV
jgi:hypothetical protein